MIPSLEIIQNYHNRTKHTLQRYAKGPETIDWEDQPDPFRRFSGCQQVMLPPPGKQLASPLFVNLDQPETIPTQALDLTSIGLLLELAFGLSAWKQFGDNRWALRCNPSSGNLHPTEAYLLITGCDVIKSGVYHYQSHDHLLEQRAEFKEQPTENELLIGLSSVHWREAWKYGERAFRYCQHDTGHALAALRYAAAVLGWSLELMADCSDSDIAQLLGLNRTADFKPNEREYPDIVCRIKINQSQPHNPLSIDDLLALVQSADWSGTANSLRAYHLYHWSVIDEVTQAAEKPRTQEPRQQSERQQPLASTCLVPASTLIRQRRSAQQFDGKMSPLSQVHFYRILSAVLPSTAAFSCWQWQAKIHLFIFVHRVKGLTPGLYALLRDETRLEKIQQATSKQFHWQKQTDDLPFYSLYPSDFRLIAKTLSCHQPIASDSAFSLAMVAEFSETIASEPWQYRRLFWETGFIGQILYLEAEAAGVRGTGIGCYFDDSVHELLGIENNQLQSLYHFTVGKPLEDKRLQTFPPYQHLSAIE